MFVWVTIWACMLPFFSLAEISLNFSWIFCVCNSFGYTQMYGLIVIKFTLNIAMRKLSTRKWNAQIKTLTKYLNTKATKDKMIKERIAAFGVKLYDLSFMLRNVFHAKSRVSSTYREWEHRNLNSEHSFYITFVSFAKCNFIFNLFYLTGVFH